MATRTPEICFYWQNRVLRAHLEHLTEEFQPELTILENWETRGLRRSIRVGTAALLAHDAAFQIRERAAGAAASGADRARLTAEARRYKELEVAAWRSFDAVFCLTDDDRLTIERELASSAPGGGAPPVRHLPVPVPGELFDAERPAAPTYKVGFMGSFRADFNRDALSYLLGEIWPAIARHAPQARLVLAGNGYEGPLKRAALAQGVEWKGFVQNLASFFAAIDLLLVPLRFGGGVRIRILEALAAGVPVLASPIAVAGLGAEDGRHLAIARGPEETAAVTARLLSQPQEAGALGSGGREWCRERHSPQVLRPVRLAAVRGILERS
jgi:glycosyltransferase involved in cell wall biosynthesis